MHSALKTVEIIPRMGNKAVMCQAAAIAVVMALASVRLNEEDRFGGSGMGLVRQYVPSTKKPSSRVVKTSARQTKSSLLTCSVSGG